MTMLIDARDLGKRYERGGRPFWALRGACLQVSSGDFVTVLGRSGSGKSTLLNILVGLLPPTEGTVSLMGEDISKLDDAKRSGLRNAHVGYVPQSAGLSPTLTILDMFVSPGTWQEREMRSRRGGLRRFLKRWA